LRSPLSVDDYRREVLAGVEALSPRNLPLENAYNCVLAEDLTAARDLPPFASSAMDGFALRSADIAAASPEHPVKLQISGEVRMGRPCECGVTDGQAVSVPTGGTMPSGADAVLPGELCRAEGRELTVTCGCRPGHNVRPAGEDLREGEILVPAGRRLEAADLGALAAGGYGRVPAVPRPRVAIVSTGDELVDPGTEPGAGQISESNSFLLKGLVQGSGCEPATRSRVPDDPSALLETLAAAAAAADAIVCSGGVSAGRDDPVKRAFARDSSVAFFRVAVQPGRPQAFGHFFGKPFFGLPGNPMAALVAFELFVRPALKKLAGADPSVDYVRATLEEQVGAAADCVRFVPVRLAGREPVCVACPAGRRRSNQLVALARADGLLEVPIGPDLKAGDPCRVIRITPG